MAAKDLSSGNVRVYHFVWRDVVLFILSIVILSLLTFVIPSSSSSSPPPPPPPESFGLNGSDAADTIPTVYALVTLILLKFPSSLRVTLHRSVTCYVQGFHAYGKSGKVMKSHAFVPKKRPKVMAKTVYSYGFLNVSYENTLYVVVNALNTHRELLIAKNLPFVRMAAFEESLVSRRTTYDGVKALPWRSRKYRNK